LAEPSLAELIEEMMNIMDEDDYPLIYDSECMNRDKRCECGADKCGSPRHSCWCPKYKEEE
jgi:hypothetical protein